MRHAPWLCLLALACVSDNQLNAGKDAEAEFDTNTSWEPPDTDTDDDALRRTATAACGRVGAKQY